MPEIIDILTPNNDQLSTFVVNVAANFVQVTPHALADLHAGNLANSKFVRGDCFIILSAGYFLPENFAVWSYDEPGGLKYSAPILTLYGTVGGGATAISSFGNHGEFKIPFPRYEFSIGTFNDPEIIGLTDATFKLQSAFPNYVDSLQISMVNVPAAIDGLTFKVTPFIKVLHNFPLTV